MGKRHTDAVCKRKLNATNGLLSSAEVHLVAGGELAYLWFGAAVGDDRLVMVGTLDGAAELRKLAKAILAEVGT